MEEMNQEQFDFIASLLRSRSKSREGCRLVLIEKMRQCDATKQLDVEPTLIAKSLAKYRRVHLDIHRLFVAPPKRFQQLPSPTPSESKIVQPGWIQGPWRPPRELSEDAD